MKPPHPLCHEPLRSFLSGLFVSQSPPLIDELGETDLNSLLPHRLAPPPSLPCSVSSLYHINLTPIHHSCGQTTTGAGPLVSIVRPIAC